MRLQPNLGEGHLALGLYRSYMENDYDAALSEMKLAAEALPNDGDVGLYLAAVLRRRGDLTQALAAYQHAEQIDPRNPVMFYDSSQTSPVCAIGVPQPNRWTRARSFSRFFRRQNTACLR